MGPRLLCFAAGAALAAFFVQLGLLATPFFGSGALLWANVFACFLLALALGHGLGDLVAALAGRTQRELSAPRLAVMGGVGAWLAIYALPLICRRVLEHDPSWIMAPAASIALASLLPGALIAAIVPSELRSRCGDESLDSAGAARGANRLLGLMTLGGVSGIALCGRAVLRPDEVDVWLQAYTTGGLLALLALPFLGALGRTATVLLLAGCVALSAGQPSEIQSSQFAVALETAWKEGQGAGLYFLRTAHKETLSEDQLRRYTKQIKASEGEKPGIILTCELLEQLGAVSITGAGLCGSLELLLPDKARPFLIPIFEKFESVRSDGEGLLNVEIKRTRGTEGTRCRIPGKEPGEYTEFLFKDDLTIHISHEQEGPAEVWRLEFGPLSTEKAGIFELHDTYSTPIRVVDVALWVDASVLGLILEDHPDQLVIKAVAQGEIGDVTTVELDVVSKD